MRKEMGKELYSYYEQHKAFFCVTGLHKRKTTRLLMIITAMVETEQERNRVRFFANNPSSTNFEQPLSTIPTKPSTDQESYSKVRKKLLLW
jgi:hypothetical protein